MKVIFLDFDGVITIPPKWYLQADLIKNVKKIVDVTGAKIVVSSSWRSENIEKTKESIIERKRRCPRNITFIVSLLTYINIYFDIYL